MTFSEIIDQAGIELLIFAVCMFFGLRLIITKDVRIVKKEHPEEIRDPESVIATYCKTSETE